MPLKELVGRGIREGITTRSIVIGLALAAIHTCWLVWEEITLGHIGVSAAMLFGSVLGVLFLLLIANSVLKRFLPRWVLAPSELMVIFCAMTVSTSMATVDLIQILLPNIMYPFYLADPHAGYDRYFHYIPSWFMPQDQDLIKGFYLGSEDPWRFFRPEVLKPWLVPVAFWSGYLLLLSLTMYCMGAVLRRQWVDREKLSFPIIELPMMMVRENTVGSLFRNRLLLGGFAVSFVVVLLYNLSGFYPAIPRFDISTRDIGPSVFTQPPFSGMNPIFISWWPFAIGLCFLMPLDVSFSSWFFYVLIRLSMAMATALGWREANAGLWTGGDWPYFHHISQGAWIGLFIVVMRSAKGHLGQVFRIAIGREKIEDDGKEPLSYRTAVLGALGGFVLLIATMMVSGMRLEIAAVFFAIYFLAVIVIARVYAQIAVPIFELSFYRSIDLTTNLIGSRAMNHREMTVISDLHWTDRTYRAHVMGHQLESMTFADKQGESMRRFTRVVLSAMAIGIVVGMLTSFQVYYFRGAGTARMAALGQPWAGAEAWNRHLTWVTDPHGPQIKDIARKGVSASIVVLLALARNLWFGFPLNPIGYAFACSYAMEYIWNIVLVTWLIKLVLLRYCGLKIYRKAIPLFLGIALGEAVVQLLWGLVRTILRV